MASPIVAPSTAIKIDALDAIGNTPLVDVSILSPVPGVRIYGKLESVNPTGSVKDRAARSLILTAERDGLIKPGDTILEPTSGNTGLGLAMIGRLRGYKVKVVMPASVPPERIKLLEAFGAEVILSHADKGTNESIVMAKQIADENPSYYMPYQYGNPANPNAHYTTTGPEIARDMPDIDVFVAGLGTGGTLMGVGRALREHNPNVKIIATAPHPDDKVQGLRSIEHGYIPPILDLEKLDGRILIEGEEAFYWTRRLLTDAGVFVGVSSGATFATARKIAQKMSDEGREGKIVAMFADGGWKYLSTGIYGEDFKFDQSEIEGKTWW
ncbi:MAG: cysteine synthase family protein [Chloroflexi bacterium]|nr:cysteine synthase family protein [Chloroflexota bacterium]